MKDIKNPYYSAFIISDIWADVTSIGISYKAVYTSAFGVLERKDAIRYNSDNPADFHIDCPNSDCTRGYFDLYPIVAQIISQHKTSEIGYMNCIGEEAKDHSNSCPTKLEYAICVEYRKGSVR